MTNLERLQRNLLSDYHKARPVINWKDSVQAEVFFALSQVKSLVSTHSSVIIEYNTSKTSCPPLVRPGFEPRCLWNTLSSRLNARSQNVWAIEDQVKNLDSIARPYDERAFSVLHTTNARSQNVWAIEDQVKNLDSIARPYDERAFSVLHTTTGWLSHLVLAIYMFVLLILILWYRQAVLESKGDQLPFPGETRIRTQVNIKSIFLFVLSRMAKIRYYTHQANWEWYVIITIVLNELDKLISLGTLTKALIHMLPEKISNALRSIIDSIISSCNGRSGSYDNNMRMVTTKTAALVITPRQWETSLQSNAISHWLGANIESAL